MSRIMFFSIPIQSSVNPDAAVVSELVQRGHRVRYYNTEEFREKIELTGAEFVPIDGYLSSVSKDLHPFGGRELTALIEAGADTTIHMEEKIAQDMTEFQPECLVADSMCIWGRLFAKKYEIPFVCSSTSPASNEHTAKRVKTGMGEKARMIQGMPRINAKIAQLNELGYGIPNFVTLIQNDHRTNTIVYTSKKFQPEAETFSDRYEFVGPFVSGLYAKKKKQSTVKRSDVPKSQPQIYISAGDICGNDTEFCQNCVEALKDLDCSVIIYAGKETDIAVSGELPPSISVQREANRLEILSSADIFVTCGSMSGVMESLYYGVPMVLFPQNSEETVIADRVEELGAGIRLKRASVRSIRKKVEKILKKEEYRRNAEMLERDFRKYRGARQAAEFIEGSIRRTREEKREEQAFYEEVAAIAKQQTAEMHKTTVKVKRPPIKKLTRSEQKE